MEEPYETTKPILSQNVINAGTPHGIEDQSAAFVNINIDIHDQQVLVQMWEKFVDRSIIKIIAPNVTSWDRSRRLPALPRVWQHVKLSDISIVTRPRYSLVVDEDVKKPTNQPKKQNSSESPGISLIFRLYIYNAIILVKHNVPSVWF